MPQILVDLLAVVLVACIPVVTRYIITALKSTADKAAASSKSTLIAICIEEIADAVSTAVEATNQTYVDSIKNSSNPFTAEAQRKAFEQAYNVAVAALSQSTKDFIEENYGSIKDFLTAKIEAQVRMQKSGASALSATRL